MGNGKKQLWRFGMELDEFMFMSLLKKTEGGKRDR